MGRSMSDVELAGVIESAWGDLMMAESLEDAKVELGEWLQDRHETGYEEGRDDGHESGWSECEDEMQPDPDHYWETADIERGAISPELIELRVREVA